MTETESEQSERALIEAARARVGQPLNAKWTLDALLGLGGIGTVYGATNRSGARAALKVLSPGFARMPSVRERFLREARIANRIDHPARVVILDDDVSDEGEPFLVMELLEGETLLERQKKSGGRLSIEEALRVFDPVLDLLGKCHELGIVHRDVKPANVFLTRTGQVKLLDFGVARMRETSGPAGATRDGEVMGTPGFIAPEQAIGVAEQIDGRTDLWAVGACLYCALSGKRLHRASSDTHSFFLAGVKPAPSLAEEAPELPVEVVALVDKALAFDRGGRFQNAQAMRSELAALLVSLKAGQLGQDRPKKASGVLVRRNEAVDVAAPASGDLAFHGLERLVAAWKNLGSAMASARQYGWDHPQTTRTLQQSYEEIARAHAASPAAVRWEVAPDSFRSGRTTVWKPDAPPFDRVPHQLYADGVRVIQLKVGLSERELRDFVAILMRDVGAGLGAEDDSVTALWDRHFEHIAYVAVDSFADGDDADLAPSAAVEEIADQAAALLGIEPEWEDGSVEASAMQKNLASAAPADAAPAAALALDPLTRATLGAQAALGPDAWAERYADVFVRAYLEAERAGDRPLLLGAVGDWTDDHVALQSFGAVFQLGARLTAAFAAHGEPADAASFEREIASVMYPEDTLRAILTELARRPGEDRGAPASAAPVGQLGHAGAVDPVTVAGLSRALELSASDALFGLACECYDAVPSAELRVELSAYLARWAAGQEAVLAALLMRAGPDLAMLAMRLLARTATPAAASALHAAFQSPHAEVRIAALTQIPSLSPDRLREEVQRLLADKTAEVRAEVLRAIARLRAAPAGPALVLRIQEPGFHDLSAAERRLWLDTVGALHPGRAEAVALEICARRQLVPTEAVERTRAIAADYLAEHGSPAALRALEDAAKKSLWNTAPVREAAARAITEIERRRGARQPEAKT